MCALVSSGCARRRASSIARSTTRWADSVSLPTGMSRSSTCMGPSDAAATPLSSRRTEQGSCSDRFRHRGATVACPASPLPPRSGMNRRLRSLVAVSRDPQREELLDVLAESADYDVVVVESIERGYSRVKQVLPDLVLVYMDIDDVGGSQLLSMLMTDRSLSGIPVETCATARAAA